MSASPENTVVPLEEVVSMEDLTASTEAENNRPKSGEVKPEEPTSTEIVTAAKNDPDREFIVTVGEEDYPLVELTLLNWKKYLSVVAPKFEGVLKNLLPLLGIAVRSFTVWRHLNESTRERLKVIAQDGDLQLLQETLHELGVTDYSFDDLVLLQKAAQSGDSVGFMSTLGTIFLKPMAGPALDAVKDLSFSSLALELDDDLADLALASLKSSLLRRKLPIDEEKIMADIEMMDGIDLFEIVNKQYRLYVKRGKIRSFFSQIMSMTTKSIGTVMPTASTTGTIPS